MRTAVDTNIFSSMWSQEPYAQSLAGQLDMAQHEGVLLIAPIVYVELLAHPRVDELFVNQFLTETDVSIAYQLQEKVWVEAARRFARYADRRRRSSHGSPKRLPADFLVGAHALVQADRLLTIDRKRYEMDFPELQLMHPAGEPI